MPEMKSSGKTKSGTKITDELIEHWVEDRSRSTPPVPRPQLINQEVVGNRFADGVVAS